ncbi:hypothetical protein [Streptomyces sp. NPDC127190]|uniref:hypothetical protein n=1 Tax=unclassified Streptomyces TaxID=2593676 RepID=UPI0036444083
MIGSDMSTRSTQATRALSRFGELAWFKLPAEYNDNFGYHQVAYMGWRFKAPSEEIAQVIDNVIQESPTQTEWTLDRTRRNWVLVPTRVLQEAQGLSDPAFSDVIRTTAIQDQEFCLTTISDLDVIVQHLQQVATPES